MQSTLSIPEPHSFTARLSLGHGGHSHDYDVEFNEHHHEHDHSALEGLDISSQEYQDAHEKAHANDIKRRFTNQNVTTGQIILFGLTGGLIPCPAAITLVVVGVAAAYSVRQATTRWHGFNTLARRAPYFSSILIAAVGIYMGLHGWAALMN